MAKKNPKTPVLQNPDFLKESKSSYHNRSNKGKPAYGKSPDWRKPKSRIF